MNRFYALKAALFAIAAFLLPVAAEAAEGFATANVNMRSGPSTRYPAVTVIPAGSPLEIYGCLEDVPWCDVSFYDGRGWVASRYIETIYRRNRVFLEPEFYVSLGIPLIEFDVGNYWDRNYRNRDFYRNRDNYRWDRDTDHGGYDRRPRRETNSFDRRPRRIYEDNNFDRPRSDWDQGRIDNNRNVITNRESVRDRDRERVERRNRDIDQGSQRANRDNNRNRDTGRFGVREERPSSDRGRGEDQGGEFRRPRCRPGDRACS